MLKNIILFLLISTFNSPIFSQNMQNLGENDHPVLTESESLFLNEYMNNEQKKGIDLKDKKVIFVTGSNGGTLSDKQEYFHKIKEWNNNDSKIQTFVIELDEKDKINSGGYDIIIGYWVKVFTYKTKQNIIKRVKSSH